jgi:DNA-directed RNA polymerase specialized sigma24 family protein
MKGKKEKLNKETYRLYLETKDDRLFTKEIYPALVDIFKDSAFRHETESAHELNDIQQECLIKVITKLTPESIESISRLDGYISRMFDNMFKDYFRKKGTYQKHVDRAGDAYLSTGQEWGSNIVQDER